MSYRPHRPDTLRHTRLFELIRQDNLVDGYRFAAPTKPTLDVTEMQKILKLANRSLRPDEDDAV